MKTVTTTQGAGGYTLSFMPPPSIQPYIDALGVILEDERREVGFANMQYDPERDAYVKQRDKTKRALFQAMEHAVSIAGFIEKDADK